MATHLKWMSAPSVLVFGSWNIRPASMEPRMYRVEPSLVADAERSGRKLPLCPGCAQSMRLIRRTQRFGTLPDLCTFECGDCGVSYFEEHEPPKPSGAVSPNHKQNAAH
jgi:hypothetical protein